MFLSALATCWRDGGQIAAELLPSRVASCVCARALTSLAEEFGRRGTDLKPPTFESSQ